MDELRKVQGGHIICNLHQLAESTPLPNRHDSQTVSLTYVLRGKPFQKAKHGVACGGPLQHTIQSRDRVTECSGMNGPCCARPTLPALPTNKKPTRGYVVVQQQGRHGAVTGQALQAAPVVEVIVGQAEMGEGGVASQAVHQGGEQARV
jgi:hypothetical protein